MDYLNIIEVGTYGTTLFNKTSKRKIMSTFIVKVVKYLIVMMMWCAG